MNKKRKSVLIVISMMLVCALSIAGTMAYLTTTTDTVTNTFTAGTLFNTGDGNGITLTESPVKADEAGNYVQNTGDRVKTNSYGAVIPGSTIYKDPQVDIKGLATESYLYIVVKNNTTDFTYSIDDSYWKSTALKLKDNETDTVYVYSAGKENAEKVKGNLSAVGIIKEDKITAKNTLSNSIGAIGFTAYLVQAVGFTDADAAWNATFGVTTK